MKNFQQIKEKIQEVLYFHVVYQPPCILDSKNKAHPNCKALLHFNITLLFQQSWVRTLSLQTVVSIGDWGTQNSVNLGGSSIQVLTVTAWAFTNKWTLIYSTLLLPIVKPSCGSNHWRSSAWANQHKFNISSPRMRQRHRHMNILHRVQCITSEHRLRN